MDVDFAVSHLLWLVVAAAVRVHANHTKIVISTDDARPPPLFEYSRERSIRYEVPVEERTLLRFVLEFAIRSEWDQIVLFVPVDSAILETYSSAIYEFFNSRGKYISIHSTSQSLLPHSLYHNRHRVGVVLLWDPHMDSFLGELTGLDVFNEYRSWLFVRRDAYRGTNISQKLSELNFGVDSNAVICRVERHPMPSRTPESTTPAGPTTDDDEPRYFEMGTKVCVPENQNEKWYKGICVTGEDLPARLKRNAPEEDPYLVITLHQIYKVSRSENGTFVQIYLGFWDPVNGLAKAERLVPVEKRFGVGGFKIVIGVRNSTFDGGVLQSSSSSSSSSLSNTFSLESDEDEEMHMREVLECLLFGLNASREIIQFAKLGWRNEEGGWTHMLGAVVDGVVDFGLDTLNVNVDVLQEMYLTHPIVKTMNNIYFRRPDSGGMRDIFLAPFSPSLLACVFSTELLLALGMIAIAVVNYGGGSDEEMKRTGVDIPGERKWEVSEAALWSVSVMCMQGSPWSPSSKSGSLLLICGLLFALVIYNAYAAFITSVLSVKNVSIKNLEDLIHSNMAFGYTLGNADELFLRTVNDTLLRELYFKGLKENDGVKDPIAGMHLAGEGNYAFFVAARTARRALRREVAHSQRCGIQELILPVTRTVAAIPMSRHSQYKKIINFKVVRMMESGILHRFQRLILPPMPKCVERNTFNSARLTDVYSAFYMIVAGWSLSLLVLAGEVLWWRRAGRLAREPKSKKLKDGKVTQGPPRHHHFHINWHK